MNKHAKWETVVVADAIDRGRESFGRQAWRDAFAQLSAAEGDSRLELEDLERLAAAAYLIGRVDDSVDAWARAHHEHVQAGEVAPAAHCAFLVGLHPVPTEIRSSSLVRALRPWSEPVFE